MGFESSRAARRRLASVAAVNTRVAEALSSASLSESAPPSGAKQQLSRAFEFSPSDSSVALAQQLDLLAHDIVATPGAGGALLAAYATQTRALLMVVEAARRAGSSPLPAAVVLAAQAALHATDSISGVAFR